jgi:hypothetical protein
MVCQGTQGGYFELNKVTLDLNRAFMMDLPRGVLFGHSGAFKASEARERRSLLNVLSIEGALAPSRSTGGSPTSTRDIRDDASKHKQGLMFLAEAWSD